MSYRDIEMNVITWGDARLITKNGTSVGQAKKTVEEAAELQEAANALAAIRDMRKAFCVPGHSLDSGYFDALEAIWVNRFKDAVGDVVVTLVMACECASRETGEAFDVVSCFRQAYEEIKDRTGHLGADGIFHKDAA